MVLKQNGNHTFHRAKVGAVNHHRPVELAILANIRQIKTSRQVVVNLGRAKLPLTSKSIPEQEVKLRPVETRLSFLYPIRYAELLDGPHNHRLCLLPRFVTANIFGASGIAQSNAD